MKGETVGATGKDEKPANAGNSQNVTPQPDGMVIANNGAPGPSAAERAILERLQSRRQELDKRGRELDIREGLIAEAEKRVDSKLTEIKQGEAQLVTATQKKDEAEACLLYTSQCFDRPEPDQRRAVQGNRRPVMLRSPQQKAHTV